MPKKKRGSHRTGKANAQQPRRRPLRAVPEPPGGGAGAMLPPVPFAAAFFQWYTASRPEDPRGDDLDFDLVDEVREVLGAIGYIVEALQAEVAPCLVTDLRPEDLRMLFEEVLPGRPELDDAEHAHLAASMMLFLSFLEETDRWGGLPSDLMACRDVAAETLMDARLESALDDLLDGAEAPQLSPEEEIAGLESSTLVRRLRTLLDWWGPGRPVTGTRAMKLADVVAAAQLFDVQVRTPAGAGTRQDTELDLALVKREGRMVRSMWEVPELASLWVTATDAGLLDLQPTTARRTAEAMLLAVGPDEDRLPVLRRVVAGYVASVLLTSEDTMGAFGTLVSSLALEVLASSLMNRALSPADVEDAVDEELPARFARAEETVNALLRGLLEHLAAMGVLTTGERYEVPEPLRTSIALAMGLVASSDMDDDDLDALDVLDDMDDDPDDEMDDETDDDRPTQPSVFQVKISLKGSHPPVWRRVVVPSDIRLDHLHAVIQSCFEWDGSHLHRFTKGHPYRADTVYQPVGELSPAPPLGGPEVVDERTRTLRDLAPRAGSSLAYLYDFGDDWEHVVRVEKTLDPEGLERVPALVAGGGRAPHEDSGGVYGWAARVAAASDPDDPEYDESRSWLGLEDGEVLDPGEFRLDDVHLR